MGTTAWAVFQPSRTLAVAAALLLAGCGSAPTTVPPSPTTAVTRRAPAGTVSLADLGWRNGPANRVLLPSGVTLTRRIDQPNLISAFGYGTDREQIRRLLAQHLPTLGWDVTGSGADALVFGDQQYQGAYTASDEVWGLTIRARSR